MVPESDLILHSIKKNTGKAIYIWNFIAKIVD
jgi:predicted transcriptional regulator YheO